MGREPRDSHLLRVFLADVHENRAFRERCGGEKSNGKLLLGTG